jgi:general secretion pathway protein C
MQLTAEHWLRRLLRRSPQHLLYDFAEAALIIVLAFQCGRLVWIALTPAETTIDWQAASPSPPNGKLTTFDPFFRSGRQPTIGTVTSLPLKLFGVRVDQATGQGSAIIAATDGAQQSYVVGDEIMRGVRLKFVAHDNVTVERGGVAEQLFLDQSSPSSVPQSVAYRPGAPFAPPESQASIASPASEFIFTPRLEKGVPTGFAVAPKRSIEPFHDAGFLAGDIVTQINGAVITSTEGAERIISGIPAGGPISFTVERAGKTITLNQKSTPR